MKDFRRFALHFLSSRRFALGALAPLAALCVVTEIASAQTLTGTIVLRVTTDGGPLAGVPVVTRVASSVTDQSGRATFRLPTGEYTFRATPPGFRPESLSVYVGIGTTMRNLSVHHETVMTQAAAPAPPHAPAAAPTTIRAAEQPVYSDVAGRAAMDEQIEQSPGVITDALGRLDGVRIQPLSAGSGGVGIRIRGLPARYTKILIDGLPLLGDTPAGQDALQISALGVDRIDVVPGVTSGSVGPAALGGSVNVVSAPPTSPSQVVVNGTTRGASDVSLWQTRTFSPRWSASLLAGRHDRGASDPDGDGWAEVGGYQRLVVRPRVYWTRSASSTWYMTGGWTSDDRRTGTFRDARLPDGNQYRDDADTRRADAGTIGRIQIDTNTLITVRGSLMREWRTRWFGARRERDRRVGVFGDVAVTRSIGANVLTGGVALDRDQYATLDTRNDYRNTTPAIYGEHTWTPVPWFGIASSARLDLQSQFGDYVSPRVSVMVRPTDAWTARLSRASGVSVPTPMTDETEAFGLHYVQIRDLQPEHATAWSLDLDRASAAVDLRASAYRTIVAHPLAIRIPPGSPIGLQIINADEPARTQGVGLSSTWRARALRVTAAYSYLDATRPVIGVLFGQDFTVDTTMHRATPYTPRHTARLEATLERDNERLIGIEARFTGAQTVADSSLAPGQAFVTIDARFEKHIGRGILFVRGSNLTNVHQAQYAPVLRTASGAAGQWADNVWAPLEGLIVNAGMRVSY